MNIKFLLAAALALTGFGAAHAQERFAAKTESGVVIDNVSYTVVKPFRLGGAELRRKYPVVEAPAKYRSGALYMRYSAWNVVRRASERIVHTEGGLTPRMEAGRLWTTPANTFFWLRMGPNPSAKTATLPVILDPGAPFRGVLIDQEISYKLIDKEWSWERRDNWIQATLFEWCRNVLSGYVRITEYHKVKVFSVETIRNVPVDRPVPVPSERVRVEREVQVVQQSAPMIGLKWNGVFVSTPRTGSLTVLNTGITLEFGNFQKCKSSDGCEGGPPDLPDGDNPTGDNPVGTPTDRPNEEPIGPGGGYNGDHPRASPNPNGGDYTKPVNANGGRGHTVRLNDVYAVWRNSPPPSKSSNLQDPTEPGILTLLL